MTKHLLAPLLCSLLALGCQNASEEAHARALELEDSPGLRVTISAAGELPESTIHALAQHLESGAKDTGAAMVKVKKEGDAPPNIEIELWGGTLPTGDIAAQLKAQFPDLAGATITTQSLPPGTGGPSMPVIAVDADLSPAEAEQQIRDQLAADGVDGDVQVDIQDGPDGKRVVKVGVEKHAAP
jgi:hypothetical protein